MSDTLILALAILSVPAAALGGFFVLRDIITAHEQKMAREQAAMDRKNGVTPGARTSPKSEGEKKRLEQVKPHFWTIVLLVVGAVAVYWGFNTQMRPADLGSWSWNHLVPLLTIWGFGHALIALNAKALDAATSVLHWVLIAGMLTLFIVLPLIGLAIEVSKPVTTAAATHRPARAAPVPLASSPRSSWPKLVIPAGGKSERIPAPPGMRVEVKGNSFLSHYVYADGTECQFGEKCPEGIVALYFTNTSTASPTMVMYAYMK